LCSAGIGENPKIDDECFGLYLNQTLRQIGFSCFPLAASGQRLMGLGSITLIEHSTAGLQPAVEWLF